MKRFINLLYLIIFWSVILLIVLIKSSDFMKTLFTILFFGIVMTSQAQSIAESSSKFLSTYDFGKTNTVNNLIIINYNTIDVFKLQDYSVITNINPASGIINNPNQNLFRVNTLNNLKQPNYVKQTIKQTTSKTTKIRYY